MKRRRRPPSRRPGRARPRLAERIGFCRIALEPIDRSHVCPLTDSGVRTWPITHCFLRVRYGPCIAVPVGSGATPPGPKRLKPSPKRWRTTPNDKTPPYCSRMRLASSPPRLPPRFWPPTGRAGRNKIGRRCLYGQRQKQPLMAPPRALLGPQRIVLALHTPLCTLAP